MEPIETVDTNFVVEVKDQVRIPVRYKNGVFTSVWELSDEDLEKLTKTKKIALHIFGEEHPLVAFSFIKTTEGEKQ